MSEKKLIFFVFPPASGHINPAASIASELNKKENVKIAFLGTLPYKGLIESSGSEYIEFADPDYGLHKIGQQHGPLDMIETSIRSAYKILPQLLQLCEERKPDAIAFDMLTFSVKFLFEYLEKNKDNLKFKIPKQIFINPSFAMLPGVFPNEEERKLMSSRMNMVEVFQKANELQSEFNKKFGINYEFTMMAMFAPPPSAIKLCCVAREFQPNADKIPMYTFVGSCIAEQVRSNAEITNDPLGQILSSFAPISPNENRLNDDSSSKLIFVSLGTVFNFNPASFEKLIEAFNKFDEEEESSRSQTKLKDLKIIFSLGKALHETFENKVKNEAYKVNENILLLPLHRKLTS